MVNEIQEIKNQYVKKNEYEDNTSNKIEMADVN